MPCEANMQPVSEAIDPVQTPMRQANLVHIGSYWNTHLPGGNNFISKKRVDTPTEDRNRTCM